MSSRPPNNIVRTETPPPFFSVGDRHHHTNVMTSLMEEGGLSSSPPFSNSNRTCSFCIPSLTPGMCVCDSVISREWHCVSLLWISPLRFTILGELSISELNSMYSDKQSIKLILNCKWIAMDAFFYKYVFNALKKLSSGTRIHLSIKVNM